MEEKEKVIRPARGGPRRVQRLLVCLDRSVFSEASLPLAVSIARGLGGRSKLVHVLESPATGRAAGPTDALGWEFVRAEAAEHLERVAERLGGEGVPAATALLQGHAAEQILCLADREESDLIVFTRHGEKGVTEWNLSSTADKIVQRARSSLLIVPASDSPYSAGAEAKLARILVPLDGSPEAECALALAQRLAQSAGADLLLLHAVPPAQLVPRSRNNEEDEELLHRLAERNQRAAREYLDRTCEYASCGGGVVRGLVESGDARQVLSTVVARELIDLVVMAAHGRTGDRNRPCGATTNDALRHVAAPVLMIQNLPLPRSEFAGAVRHTREARPLRGGSREAGA